MAPFRKAPVTFQTGPWAGMWWAHPPATERRVYQCYNGWVDDAGSYRSRPGVYRVSASQLASGGVGQLVYQFTKVNGTQYTVVICGGKFYTLNWATGVLTETVTGSHLSGASITLSSSARCYAVTLNDQMIVSDGVNTPWMWDGTAGAGLTLLSDCPVLYGQPTVYYAKLFGIKNAERSTVVWSEENDPTTGYEAGGFNNAWTLSQTGSDPLYAIRATNDALYYWRQRSIGAIRGQVDSNFVNSGVVDAVSTLVGTRSPAGVCIYNDTAYFPDEYGRPCGFATGGQVEEIWRQVALLFSLDSADKAYLFSAGYTIGVSAAQIAVMETLPFRALGGIQFRHNSSGVGTLGSEGAIYFGQNNTAQGIWQFATRSPAVGGEVVNSVTNLPEILEVTTDGYVFSSGKADQWVDQDSAGTNTVVTLQVTIPRLGSTAVAELRFDRADVVVGARSAGAVSVSCLCKTSRQQLSTGVTLTNSVTGSVAVEERKTSFGLAKQGRWAQPVIVLTHGSASAAGFSLALHEVALLAFPYATTPGVP